MHVRCQCYVTPNVKLLLNDYIVTNTTNKYINNTTTNKYINNNTKLIHCNCNF